jgi:hypothetical protein
MTSEKQQHNKKKEKDRQTHIHNKQERWER